MPDVYISRAGVDSTELDEKFTQTELSALKDQLIRVEQAAKIKDERILQHGVSGFELFDERGLLVDGRHDSRGFTIDLRAHAAAGNLPRPAQVGCSTAQILDRPDKGIVVAK